MPKPTQTPWDVKLSDDDRKKLGQWLSRELDNALNARTASEAEVAYWHVLYEQGRTRSARNQPWADAADLTSPIGTEKVDALRARIVKTIFVEPIWTVEGWGEAAKKAPFVEEFHQWQAEASGFQSACARAIHLSLIEPLGVLEVYEDSTRRPVRRKIRAALQLSQDGRPLIGENMQPVLQQGPDGKHVEVPDDPQIPPDQQPPTAEVVIDDFEVIARGPQERTIPYRDFLILPGHARENSEVWGYAKRFWRRVDQLQERAKDGVYDADAVDALGDADERQSSSPSNAGGTTLAGDGLSIPQQEQGLAEKELFEVLFLYNLDKTGYRWYVATIHKDSSTILRLQVDDIGRPRYFCFVPFPRPNSIEGYSFIGHKLITTIEENTAWRNMLADRAALQLKVPMKRQQNALWDPEDEPIGANAVITVRDMNEVQPMQLPDYTSPGRERIIDTERQAEKLGGMTDIAAGSRPQENRTLGETRLVTAFSEVRIEEVVRNVQETLEDIAEVRHLMWKRALSEMPEGMEAPSHVLDGLESRAVDVSAYIPNKKFAASVMEGAFRFKPRGSVESADRHAQRQDWAEFLKATAALGMVNPMIKILMTLPDVGKALLEHTVRIYGISDKQAFLGQQTWQAVQAALQQQQMMAQAQAMMGAQPGQPPQPGGPPRPQPRVGPGPPQPMPQPMPGPMGVQ